jgi:hypothetical protein
VHLTSSPNGKAMTNDNDNDNNANTDNASKQTDLTVMARDI